MYSDMPTGTLKILQSALWGGLPKMINACAAENEFDLVNSTCENAKLYREAVNERRLISIELDRRSHLPAED